MLLGKKKNPRKTVDRELLARLIAEDVSSVDWEIAAKYSQETQGETVSLSRISVIRRELGIPRRPMAVRSTRPRGPAHTPPGDRDPYRNPLFPDVESGLLSKETAVTLGIVRILRDRYLDGEWTGEAIGAIRRLSRLGDLSVTVQSRIYREEVISKIPEDLLAEGVRVFLDHVTEGRIVRE